jgi:hypothetical protein
MLWGLVHAQRCLTWMCNTIWLGCMWHAPCRHRNTSSDEYRPAMRVNVWRANCRQPVALIVATPRTPWALTWAGRNLLHLDLSDSKAVNLHWIAGVDV